MSGIEITVATWNINQWPWPGSFVGAGARRQAVLQRLTDYDVVCLQECWSAAARELRLSTPYHFLDRLRSAVGFSSGLLTVCRQPVLAGSSRRYEARSFPDSLAAKGMTMTRISVHGFGEVNVFNTHLQAWRGEGIRNRQLQQLAEFVKEAPEADAAILAGDLNCLVSVPQLSELRTELAMRDLLDEVRPACADASSRGKVRFTGDDARVDHLLLATRPGVEVKVLETGIIPGPERAPYPSDHHGIFARLVLGRSKGEEAR